MPVSKLSTVYCQMITLQICNLDVKSSECAFQEVKQTIQDYRDHGFEWEEFEMVHKEALDVQDKLDPDPRSLPRVRRLPKKLCGGAATPVIELAHHFRILYHQFLSKIIVELEHRYSMGDKRNDLAEVHRLVKIFKDGIVPSYLSKYKELNLLSLRMQLQSFLKYTRTKSLLAAKHAFTNMS